MVDVQAAPDFEKTTIAKKLADGTTDNPKYADYTGFMVSSLLLGYITSIQRESKLISSAFVGSVPASYCADKFGRRVASESLPFTSTHASHRCCIHLHHRRNHSDRNYDQGDDDGRSILRWSRDWPNGR
jgi:hypothetical protein